MTQAPVGGPAATVYQVASRKGVVGRDAQRVIVVTDGRPAEGGPQQAAYFVTDAEIAAGEFIPTGNKPLPIVLVGAQGAEYPPVAYYNVTGKENDFPPVPAPIAPSFVSAEIGLVDASTVTVTFDRAVDADENDYLSGVTITFNDNPTGLIAGFRQTNHAIVYYDLVAAASSTDVLSWAYNDSTGIIVSEADGAPLATVAAQAVTNNVPLLPLLDLEADTLVLNDGDPVSTWADQSGNGNDFTQTGDARPIYRVIGDVPRVRFDGIDDFLEAGNFADNLPSFSIFVVKSRYADVEFNSPVLSKILYDGDGTGWVVFLDGDSLLVQQDGSNYRWSDASFQHDFNILYVYTHEALAWSSPFKAYQNSVDWDPGNTVGGTVANMSNSQNVRIGTEGNPEFAGYMKSDVCAIRIYSPAPSPTNRAAIEAELAARYGITLP